MVNNSTNINKTINHLKSLNLKDHTDSVGNPEPVWRQTQEYGRAMSVNVIATPPPLMIN